MKRLLFLLLTLFFVTACGLGINLPSDEVSEPSQEVNIVEVSKLSYSTSGVEVTCEINPLILSPNLSIPVFIEFEGLKIETLSLANQAKYKFSHYVPPYNGNIKCVVDYKNSEFESSAQIILKDKVYTNGASAIVFNNKGGILTWGGQVSGGDSTNKTNISASAGYLPDDDNDGYSDLLKSHVKKVEGYYGTTEYGATNSYAALKNNGSVVTWGYSLHGGDVTGKSNPPLNIKVLPDVNNDFVADSLSSNVVDISYSMFAYAALKKNGSVITWGDNDRGGDSTGSTNPAASVKTLVDLNANGISDILESQVEKVVGNVYGFAALKKNGSVVAWGNGGNGGDATGTTASTNHSLIDSNANQMADLLESDVVDIIASRYSFSAIKSNGSVVSWGHRRWGGDQTRASGDAQATPLVDLNADGIGDLLESNVKKLFGGYRAYAALKNDGSVVTWGHDAEGGDSTHINNRPGYGYLPDLNLNGVADLLESNVIDIFRTRGGFAALKSNGSLVVWGNFSRGGDPTGIATPPAGTKSLSDLNNDFIADELSSDIVKVYSGRDAFVAIKTNGQAIVWGGILRGGDPINATSMANVGALRDLNNNGIADPLESGVVGVLSSEHALAAIKDNGSVVAWGSADKGGDPLCLTSPVQTKCLQDLNNDGIADQLESGVIQVVPMAYAGFIAIKSNGELISWGSTEYGGDLFNQSLRTDIGYLEDMNGNFIPDLLEI